jgi:hypothetical protein
MVCWVASSMSTNLLLEALSGVSVPFTVATTTAEGGAPAHLSFTRKPDAIAAHVNPWTAAQMVGAQPRTVRSSIEMVVVTSTS